MRVGRPARRAAIAVGADSRLALREGPCEGCAAMTMHTFQTGLLFGLALAFTSVAPGCMPEDGEDALLLADESTELDNLADASVTNEAKPDPIPCGGFAGFACPDGMTCKDVPGDDCNPKKGGADCPGVCKGKNTCDYSANDKTWISKSANECAVIQYLCADGMVPFSNECGCGCEEPAGEPCNGVECGEGYYCCNFSCSICAPDGGYCTQQFCG